MPEEVMVIREVGNFKVPMFPHELTRHDIERMIGDVVKQAPSYPKLLRAYISFKKSLSPYLTTEEIMSGIEGDEGSLLTAHAGVMNAKSSRAQTLRRLADDVFREAELPRRPQGKFRGEDDVDIDEFIKSRGIEQSRYSGQIGAIYRRVVEEGELLECMICHQMFGHLTLGTCESCYKKWTGARK